MRSRPNSERGTERGGFAWTVEERFGGHALRLRGPAFRKGYAAPAQS
jgi:hypothetical protein